MGITLQLMTFQPHNLMILWILWVLELGVLQGLV